MVQGSFEGERWNKHATSLAIIIVPPWWRTWWFYGLVFSITSCMMYGFYRYRLYQLTKLKLLRNRIARDLHDEVGSSISTIAIYSKIVQQHLGSPTFNNEALMKKITENANEIMESMNDIIWSINSRNDTFENIINRMREHAFQLLDAKGYLLHFDFEESLKHMELKMERRRDFYLIYKEALNNIAKYAEGKNVWISLSASYSRINLTIKDDGKGFDMKTIRKNSNGLINMKYRTEVLNGKIEIISAPGKGTEIRVSFNKQ
jgi:signal transduction histidine kinase